MEDIGIQDSLLRSFDAIGPNSDRYWSLKPITSDIESNKIITGARLVKKDRIIQIEIEQSTALPEGNVNETQRSWLGNTDFMSTEDRQNVHEMTYEARALDLDILEAPPGHVITGLRFRLLGGHVNLEAQITPINFKDGQLDSNTSTWIGNDRTQASESRRTRVSVIVPDIPTRYLGKSYLDSRNNQVIYIPN